MDEPACRRLQASSSGTKLHFKFLPLPAAPAKEQDERLPGLFIVVGRDLQLKGTTLSASDCEIFEQAIRMRFGHFIFLFPHEPAL
jgi:hypothetical protein